MVWASQLTKVFSSIIQIYDQKIKILYGCEQSKIMQKKSTQFITFSYNHVTNVCTYYIAKLYIKLSHTFLFESAPSVGGGSIGFASPGVKKQN